MRKRKVLCLGNEGVRDEGILIIKKYTVSQKNKTPNSCP